MLPSSRRLSTTLFDKVLKQGKFFSGSMFTIRVLKAQGMSRFSVVISKKIAKKAVERNKIRRRVYSSLNTLLPRLTDGFLCVFMMKDQIKAMEYEKIKKNIEDFFVNLSILK